MLEHFLSASNTVVYSLLLLVIISCRYHLENSGKILLGAAIAFAGYFLSLYLSANVVVSQLLISAALSLLLANYVIKTWPLSAARLAAICCTLILTGSVIPFSWLPIFEAVTLFAIAAIGLKSDQTRNLYTWATCIALAFAAVTGLSQSHFWIHLISYSVLALVLATNIIVQLNRQLYMQANSDPLSQLPNRRCLNEHAEALANREQSYWLLLFTLDGIKQINDTYGFSAGDSAIWVASRKMISAVGNKDFLGRNFAKEFVIITERSKTELDLLIAELEGSIRAIESIDKHNVSMGIHCGLAFNNGAKDSFSECLQSASAALQFAESQQLNHAFVNESILESVNRRNDLEQGLRQAISEKSLQVHFQPKYDCHQPEKIVGAEALARWQYKGENISPFEFIKLAEECNLIADLDKVIMEKSWLLGKQLQEQGISIKIAANFSPTSLLNGVSLLKMVKGIIEDNKLDPRLIEIEITESYLAHGEDIKNQLQVLRDMGISVAMDDFGTGFSNLGQLEGLPLDTLKIDKIFVDKLLDNPTVTEFIVDLAQKLKLQLVAEGVEEDQQLQWLSQHSCQMIQGYLLSRPLPEADFVSLLEQTVKRPPVLKIAK